MVPGPEIDLEALDAYLLSDISPEGCMLLSDLDGFLTGIAVGPESIPESEWLPVIWAGKEPEFESEQQMQTVLGTIMGRYNQIAATIDAESFAPIFDHNLNGDLIITDWAGGFIDAIILRSNAWKPLLEHHRAKLLLEPLIILGDEDDFFGRATPEIERRFYASQPKVISVCVVGIYNFWRDWESHQKPHPRRNRGGRR